jgi:hypothetical protein
MKTKLTAIFIFIFLTISASAQNEIVQNLRNYDRRPLHFGFTIGLNSADFIVRNSDNFFDISEIGKVFGVEAEQSVGFHLGPISNFRINDNLDLRILFDLTFSQRNLNYYILTDVVENGVPQFENYTMKLTSTFIEFPVLLKYKSQRINNYRIYVVGGLNPKVDLAAKKKIPEIEQPKIRIKQPDLFYELGLGIDLYTTYFKFSPEIKFGTGFKNMLNQDGTEYSSSIKYLKSTMFMLSFHFE